VEDGVLLLEFHALDPFQHRLDDLGHALHERTVEQPADHLDVADPGVLLEPDGVRGAAPGQGQSDLVLTRDHHVVELAVGRPLDVLVLLEVVGLGQGGVDEDGGGRGDGRSALPEHDDVEGVEPGLLQGDVGRDLARRVHLGDPGRQQQALGGHVVAVLRLGVEHPVLLARGVGVVAAGGEAGLDHLVAELGEGADGVDDGLGAGEELGQGVGGMLDLGDLVVGRLDARHVALHGAGEAVLVPPRGDEGEIELPQVFADEPAGVSRGPIDNDGLGAHVITSCLEVRPSLAEGPRAGERDFSRIAIAWLEVSTVPRRRSAGPTGQRGIGRSAPWWPG
jgi:hypothetical protein